MGNVVLDISMSLDGFITASDRRPEEPMGKGGERLHEWAFNSPDERDRQILEKGEVPGAVIAGRRTYDTCYRARAIFGVKRALLVTQRFHLPRALFLCNALGLEASGVEANNLNYRKSSLFIWNFREGRATVAAFLDLYVDKPIPVLGMPEPIFVD